MTNGKKQTEQQQAPAPKPQMVPVALYPIALHTQVVELIREMPHRTADPIIAQLQAVQISEIAIGPMNG